MRILRIEKSASIKLAQSKAPWSASSIAKDRAGKANPEVLAPRFDFAPGGDRAGYAFWKKVRSEGVSDIKKIMGRGKKAVGMALKTSSVWVKFADGSNYSFKFVQPREMEDFYEAVNDVSLAYWKSTGKVCPGCEFFIEDDEVDDPAYEIVVEDGQRWHRACLNEVNRANAADDEIYRDYDPDPPSEREAKSLSNKKTAQDDSKAQSYTPAPHTLKKYRCKRCGHEMDQRTNHYGPTHSWGRVNTCPNCPPWAKYPEFGGSTQWECMEQESGNTSISKTQKQAASGELHGSVSVGDEIEFEHLFQSDKHESMGTAKIRGVIASLNGNFIFARVDQTSIPKHLKDVGMVPKSFLHLPLSAQGCSWNKIAKQASSLWELKKISGKAPDKACPKCGKIGSQNSTCKMPGCGARIPGKPITPYEGSWAQQEEARKKKTTAQSNKADQKYGQPKTYTYYINLDERGSFYADVRNSLGETVFDIKAGNELGPDKSSIFEDGYMKHKHDMVGLKDYLIKIGVIAPQDRLMDA